MRDCGTVATCVWQAYGLRPSHFDCLCLEGIQLTRMNGVRASTLAFLTRGCAFDSSPEWWSDCLSMGMQRLPMVDRQPKSWWRTHNGGQSGGYKCVVNNQQVDKTTIHHIFTLYSYLDGLTFETKVKVQYIKLCCFYLS